MSIRTSIELDDGVSKNLMRIYHNLQLTINGFEALQRQMNRMQPVSIDAQINIPDQVPQIHTPDVLIHPIVDEVDIPKLDIPPAIVPVELSQPEPIPVQIRPEIEDIPSIKPISVPIKPTLDTVLKITAEISQVVNHLPPQTIEAQLEVPDEISTPKVNAPKIDVHPTVEEVQIPPINIPTPVTVDALIDVQKLEPSKQRVVVEPLMDEIPPQVVMIYPKIEQVAPLEVNATANICDIDIPSRPIQFQAKVESVMDDIPPQTLTVHPNIEQPDPVSIQGQIIVPEEQPEIIATIKPFVIPDTTVNVQPEFKNLPDALPIDILVNPVVERMETMEAVKMPVTPELEQVSSIDPVIMPVEPVVAEIQKANIPEITAKVNPIVSKIDIPTNVVLAEVEQPKPVTINAIVNAQRLKFPTQMVAVEPVVKGIEQLPEPPTIQVHIEPLVDEIPPVELTATINSGNIDIPQIEITATPTFDNVVNLPVIPVIDDNIELEPIAINVEPILSSIPRVDIPDTTVNVQPQINQMPNIPPIRATIEPVGNNINNNGNNPPGQWNSPENVEVFNGNGMERYTREIQSATEMTNRMAAMQQQIQSQANNTHLFPPNMVADLSNMNNRVAGLRTSLEQLANRPIDDMGAEQANREIESLRQQLSRAVHEQGELTRAMERMDISAANAAYNRLNANLNITEREIRDNINAQEQFNQRIREGANGANALRGKIKGIAAAYLGMQGISSTIQLSDQLTNTSARLNLIVDDGGSVEELRDKIFAVAENSRAPFLATANMVSKLGMQASDAFANNDELLFFAEQINKQFAIAGTSTQGIESVMLQLTQAMAAGKLQGEELNAVLDNAQPIVKNIADYMGVPVGEIKEMASEGQITAEIIKNAMFAAADKTNAAFESMPITWGQLGAILSNNLIQIFDPLLQAVGRGAQFVYDNWATLEPIFWGLAVAAGAYAVGLGIQTVATWIATGAAKAFFITLLSNPLFWIALAIGVVVAAIYKWVQSVGGLKVAWMICCNAILTAWDWVKIGFFTGIYWVLDLWDKLKLGLMTAGVGIQNYMGDMKVSVLMILQDMVNGAIGIINDFISTLNKLPGVSIDLISQVTFGTTAQLKNAAAKAARNADLAAYRSEIDANIAGRDAALNQMRNNALDATAKRETNIAAVRSEAQKNSALRTNDTASAVGPMAGDVGKIADNTGAMKDSVDMSEEDLKYLRDIAEQEGINRFTTAELKIDFTNHNAINSNLDLDGVVSYIEDKVTETLISTAEGVHV